MEIIMYLYIHNIRITTIQIIEKMKNTTNTLSYMITAKPFRVILWLIVACTIATNHLSIYR